MKLVPIEIEAAAPVMTNVPKPMNVTCARTSTTVRCSSSVNRNENLPVQNALGIWKGSIFHSIPVERKGYVDSEAAGLE